MTMVCIEKVQTSRPMTDMKLVGVTCIYTSSVLCTCHLDCAVSKIHAILAHALQFFAFNAGIID